VSIEDKVKEIIVEQLGVDPSQLNANTRIIDDLGADSLDAVELVMAFEEEFSLEISDEDAEKMTTIKDIFEYLNPQSQSLDFK
jgi:acyl carrier protein